ncbi:hypothetical protein D3C85_1407820 [compost metagenome]
MIRVVAITGEELAVVRQGGAFFKGLANLQVSSQRVWIGVTSRCTVTQSEWEDFNRPVSVAYLDRVLGDGFHHTVLISRRSEDRGGALTDGLFATSTQWSDLVTISEDTLLMLHADKADTLHVIVFNTRGQ